MTAESSPLEPIGPNIWIAEGRKVPFLGLSLGTRMTAIRLTDGGVWLHSPIPRTAALAAAVDAIGPVSAIVAPNKYHHLFLADWIESCPAARVYASPGLRSKRPDLRFDADLDEGAAAWSYEIEQVMFTGSRSFDEAVFFHRASVTAILTDLIVNVRLSSQPLVGRLWGALEGVGAPNGSTPLLFRLSMRDRSAGRLAVEQMLSWAPRAVIIAHGEWFREGGTQELRRRFAWLLER